MLILHRFHTDQLVRRSLMRRARLGVWWCCCCCELCDGQGESDGIHLQSIHFTIGAKKASPTITPEAPGARARSLAIAPSETFPCKQQNERYDEVCWKWIKREFYNKTQTRKKELTTQRVMWLAEHLPRCAKIWNSKTQDRARGVRERYINFPSISFVLLAFLLRLWRGWRLELDSVGSTGDWSANLAGIETKAFQGLLFGWRKGFVLICSNASSPVGDTLWMYAYGMTDVLCAVCAWSGIPKLPPS